jgi:hypothetical protein
MFLPSSSKIDALGRERSVIIVASMGGKQLQQVCTSAVLPLSVDPFCRTVDFAFKFSAQWGGPELRFCRQTPELEQNNNSVEKSFYVGHLDCTCANFQVSFFQGVLGRNRPGISG